MKMNICRNIVLLFATSLFTLAPVMAQAGMVPSAPRPSDVPQARAQPTRPVSPRGQRPTEYAAPGMPSKEIRGDTQTLLACNTILAQDTSGAELITIMANFNVLQITWSLPAGFKSLHDNDNDGTLDEVRHPGESEAVFGEAITDLDICQFHKAKTIIYDYVKRLNAAIPNLVPANPNDFVNTEFYYTSDGDTWHLTINPKLYLEGIPLAMDSINIKKEGSSLIVKVWRNSPYEPDRSIDWDMIMHGKERPPNP